MNKISTFLIIKNCIFVLFFSFLVEYFIISVYLYTFYTFSHTYF